MTKLTNFNFVGCAINDDILLVLAPALIRIKMVHLGRNPISSQGWEAFKNCHMDETSIGGHSAITHLSLNMLTDSGEGVRSGSSKYLHASGMEHLAYVLPHLEEVDLSGQHEVGTEGWATLAAGLRLALEKNQIIKLRALKLASCKIKEETKKMLEDTAHNCNPSLKIDFGHDETDTKRKRAICC